MTASKFVFVGQPHDPYTISGSDPYNSFNRTADGAGNARLAAWYNCDLGNFVTGTLVDSSNGSLWMLRDISGNSKISGVSAVQRNLYRSTDHRPIITGSGLGPFNASNHHISGDAQNCLMGSNALDGNIRAVHMQNASMESAANLATNNANSLSWISGSKTTDTGVGMEGGRSLFVTMRLKNEGNDGYQADQDYPFTVTYPSCGDGDNRNGEQGPFSLGLAHGGEEWGTNTSPHSGKRMMCLYYKDENSVIRSMNETRHGYYPDTFHALSMTYDNQNTTKSSHAGGASTAHWKLSAYKNSMPVISMTGSNPQKRAGEWHNTTITDYDSARTHPRHYKPTIFMGGHDDSGGGKIMDTNMENFRNAIHEYFVFDDALSDIRRQQMERYMCDRLDLKQSSSSHLSQFRGGPKGQAYLHTRLGSPLAGNGDYCRAYAQMDQADGTEKVHYETAAGAFFRSTADSGAFHRVPSTQAIRLESWVRAESLTESNHDGSHVALVAKATSPFGHQMDNIKGYALKFGTFADGTKPSNTLSLRLSLRNSDQWKDGTTAESCGDISVSHGSISLAVNTWFKIRLTVTPSGHAYDYITCEASTDGTTGRTLQDGSSNTSWKVMREDANYRYWCNDPDFSSRVRSQNGIHNGYWVSLKSTDGTRVDTRYYIDGFTCMVDTI